MSQSTGSLETSNQNSQQSQSLPANNPANSQQVQNSPDGSTDKPALNLREMFSLSDDGTVSLDTADNSDDDSPVDSLDRAIKKLGISAEDAYKIKIPLRDGLEPVTLGYLKDRVGKVVDLEQQEIEFSERRRQQEGETLQAQAEMRELLELIPREHIKPELVEKVRRKHEATLTRERKLTIDHIPEWRNEETRRQDMEGMIEYLKEYGFSESFLGTVIDHRSLKLIRDSYRTNQRIKAALKDVKDAQRKGVPPSSKGGKTAAKKPANQEIRQQSAPNQRSKIVDFFQKSEK